MRKIDRRIVIVVSVIFILGLAYGLMKFFEAQKEAPPVRRAIEARRFVKVEPVKYTNIPFGSFRDRPACFRGRSGYCCRSFGKH